MQAHLDTLQSMNEPAPAPAPALARGALTGGQDPAATASEEPKTGRGTVHGRLHLAAETTTALAGTTALGEAAAATLKGLAAADPLATHSETHSDAQSATSPAEATTPITLPMTSAEATASALSGPGLALPQASVPAPGAAPATSNLPAAQAQIAASPDSPAFAPELGAQISTFVRQGVERAQLQLHPAEMGPVTVQILVEGAAAQVRLWADQPGTRQALEQAMPTLAGQLRESGLTLTGGGVFEQAQQTPEQAWHEARHGNGFRRAHPQQNPAGPSLAALQPAAAAWWI
jgi:flagellar hook-length control protein FliK